MSKKRRNFKPVEVEKPRYLARGVGYSSSKFVGQSSSDRSHWIVRDDAECVPKDYQEGISKAQRDSELEAKAEQRRSRLDTERKIAEAGGQSLLRRAKKLAASLRTVTL